MVKRILILTGIVSLISTAAIAASQPEPIWASGALRLSDRSSPAYMAETFISLGNMDTMSIFTEPLIYIKDSKLGADIGVGSRLPVFSNQALIGYNGFVDFETENSQKRISMGAEFFYPYFSAHVNMYLPFSDEHDRREAVPGMDLTFGIPLPSASFVTLWPGFYFYSGRDRSDMKGFSLTVEARPIRILSLSLGGRNDAIDEGRNDRGEVFAKVEVIIPMKRLGEDLFKFDRGEYPVNVDSMMDHRIVREPFVSFERRYR